MQVDVLKGVLDPFWGVRVGFILVRGWLSGRPRLGLLSSAYQVRDGLRRGWGGKFSWNL